jgi:hypothetical protein
MRRDGRGRMINRNRERISRRKTKRRKRNDRRKGCRGTEGVTGRT